MKRYITLTVLLLVLLTSLTSCRATVCGTLLTGGEGGPYFSLGNALSDLLSSNEDEDGEKVEEKYTASFNVVSTSGYAENLEKLSKGEAQFAIARSDVAYYAQEGKAIYEGKPLKNFSLVMELYSEAVHIIAQIGTGDVASLQGKKVCVGLKGSPEEIIAKEVLRASGVGEYTPVNMGQEAAVEAFKNGEIDAYIFLSGLTSRIVSSLSSEYTFEMLGLMEEAIEHLTEDFEFLKPFTVSKSKYSVLKNTVKTVTVRACLLASDKTDKETVYNVAKRFAEDSKLLEHSKESEISAEYMWDDTCINLHKGAEKYKKEYEKKLEEEAKRKEEAESNAAAMTSEIPPESETPPEE